jgi:hypothetical protein
MGAISRYLNYLFFYIGAFLNIMLKKPVRLMYFETLSSFPVYLYKKIFSARTPVFIHYHEYTSPAEYETGMRLANFFHHREKWLYDKAVWISHTNDFRMKQFLKDIYPIRTINDQILPNYPPLSWYTVPTTKVAAPVRFVYAGALSIETMYTKEFANWIINQNGRATWDIYSLNITWDAQCFFKELNSEWIRFRGGIDYTCLPQVLKEYNIGIILYNGHIPNYIYNAPNKMFEYMACGLDVWFPDIMTGSLQYINKEEYPKVLGIDYNAMHLINLDEVVNRDGLLVSADGFYCENVLPPLVNKLTELIEE